MLTTLEFYLILIFTFEQHINFLTKTCLYHWRNLSCIRSSLGFGTARIIATALVHSKLDYCNSLCYCLPSSQINQLQVIQNSLARAVTKTPRFCRISPVLQSLHWLKIEQRIVYKLISLTYIQHNSPLYLANKLELRSNRSTRSASVITLRRPPVKLTNNWKLISSRTHIHHNDRPTCFMDSTSILPHGLSILNTLLLIADNVDRP